jgi:hypothetical protein
VENLAQDLENALTAKTLVQSELFIKALQKRTARQMLPNMEDDEMAKIDKEIEASAGGGSANPFGAGANEEGGAPGEGGEQGGKLVPLPTTGKTRPGSRQPQPAAAAAAEGGNT